MTIWKYELPVADDFSLPLPRFARFLSAQLQGGVPMAWFMVDPSADVEPRHFALYGTGNPIPASRATFPFLATIQAGRFVWQLFEVFS